MKKIIFGILLFAPAFVFANVRINEIAWMGTANSSNDEWIELYNDGDSSVDLTNWTLSISTKKLMGTIPAKGYFLLERTDDTTVPTITADFIYTGALSDSGVRLVLQNSSGVEVDFVDASAGWEKGNSVTKETMQWDGSKWITAVATPKAENKIVDTATPDSTTKTTTDTTSETSSPSSVLDTSAHVSPLPLSDFSQKQEVYISAGRNRIVAVGSPVIFETFAVDAKGIKSQNIASVWSFGDGSQAGGMKATHVYKYPGDYVVVLNANTGGNDAVSRAEVRVFAPKIVLAKEDDGAVSLMNNSAYEINIGGWKITTTNGSFIASADTIVKAGKKLIFPKDISGMEFSAIDSAKLFSPDGTLVASFEKKEIPELKMETIVPVEIPVVEKKIESPIVAPPVSINITPKQKSEPQKQMASVALALSEKEKPQDSAPAEVITLKKPEGFFAKVWHFVFR